MKFVVGFEAEIDGLDGTLDAIPTAKNVILAHFKESAVKVSNIRVMEDDRQ